MSYEAVRQPDLPKWAEQAAAKARTVADGGIIATEMSGPTAARHSAAESDTDSSDSFNPYD